MKTRTVNALALLTVACALTTVTLRASDPMGVYAVVERVVFEPSETEPQRIQVWGAFALSDRRSADTYQPAQSGYLYYTCPAGQATVCRNEWADIKSVAGKGLGIGFGGRYAPTGRVRKADEKPATPDVYPIRMGVIRMGGLHDQPAIIAQLKAALPRG
jgi:hypothetical protein